MKLFSTSCETLFLGWDAPLIPRAVRTLRERLATDDRLDLSDLVCVLPSSRSVRRLDVLLRREAESRDLRYLAPQIITVGQLAELLYEPKMPIALELEQTLAWARVLRSRNPDELKPLISSVPSPEPIGPWLELAAALRRLHEELSSSRLEFRDVVEATETESEQRRWQLLARLFAAYQSELTQAGLTDPHCARRDAVRHDRCQTDQTIVLIGTSDLSDALVAMLRSLDRKLIAMVAAPPEESVRFDEFGCVDTEGWVGHHLPIEDHHLVGAGDVADQAIAVAESLAEFAKRCSPDQVTVGVTDESHVGPVEVELRGCAVSTFRHLGWTISQTSVGRLLDLTATHLHQQTWASLAALVRHADVCALITYRLGQQDSRGWLTQLDHLRSDYFPIRVVDPLPPEAMEKCPVAGEVSRCVQQWLAVFSQPDRSIAQWSEAIDAWLTELYQEKVADQDGESSGDGRVGDRTMMALDAVQRVVRRFVQLNDHLDLTVSGASAIEMLAGRCSDLRVIGSARPEDVEILGWLDLALDDAPAIAVIGLNHPFVPSAVTSDPFLPGSLRSKLRMADNNRRYARDVYAMHLMLSTREAIRFIVGRRAGDQSPTPPSRLLAASPTVDAARRIRALLGGGRDRVVVRHDWDAGPSQGCLPIPQIDSSGTAGDSVKVMSVTAFRDYLACPYRFYLRHVLKLRPLDDATGELAANQFGDLVHGALERFGESDDRDEPNRAKIEALLLGHLHAYAAQHYGDAVSTAVTLQIAQAERRLKAVATAQAQRIAEGWKIHASEAAVDERGGAGIDVDGRRMGLRGRFDRIDHHAQTDRWAILDYKTHGHRPEKKHLKKTDGEDRWIDLQLPLYRMMIPFLGIEAVPSEVELGYFNISEKDEQTRINIAEFRPQQIEQAEQLVEDCVRRIWAGDFEPTKDPILFDDYGMILQTGVASRLLDQAESLSGVEVEA